MTTKIKTSDRASRQESHIIRASKHYRLTGSHEYVAQYRGIGRNWEPNFFGGSGSGGRQRITQNLTILYGCDML